MPRSGYLAYITPVDRQGRPVDPDWGVDEGGYPDHELPGLGEHPDHGLPPGWGGFPGHPDQGLPGQRPPHVGNRPPGSGGRPPRPGQGLPRPGRPVDPGYGVGSGEHPGHLPVWPIGPDQGLPPVPGQPLPPTDPPPGTIWPPLPPGAEVPSGKAILLAAIQGVGYRYIVVQIEPGHPDQGLPGEGEETQPPAPDQGLPQPPTPQPKSRLGR
jgi:hypothetical protein